MKITLSEIQSMIGGELSSDAGDIAILGLSTIASVKSGHLIFAATDKYLEKAIETDAAAILISDAMQKPENKPYLVVDNPMLRFSELIHKLLPQDVYEPAIHSTAIIAPDVILGESVYIGPYVVIESGCTIGDNVCIHSHCVIGRRTTIGNYTTLMPHVSIYHDIDIENHVTIHSGTVIGADGFGYISDGIKHHKIPHVGTVQIESNVEIGANACVDRATLDKTTVGQGTKVDNLVQIAHNASLGQHNILCGFSGVAGSAKTGNHVTLAANAGIGDHAVLGDGVTLGGRSGVLPNKTIPSGGTWLGTPAQPAEKTLLEVMALQRLPAIRKTVLSLQKELKALKAQLSETS